MCCHSMKQGDGCERAHPQRRPVGSPPGWSSWRCCSPRFSLWTAIPLSWVYIASKVSHTQFPSGGPYAVVVVGIVVSVLVVAWLIGRLNDLYIRITGTNRLAPMRPDLAAEHARHRARCRARSPSSRRC